MLRKSKPPKPPAKPRRVRRLHILFTDEESDLIAKVSRAAGLSMSAYCRQASLERAGRAP